MKVIVMNNSTSKSDDDNSFDHIHAREDRDVNDPRAHEHSASK